MQWLFHLLASCHCLLFTAGTAARPSPWCVEELSACLLDFRSPHVLLYAAAAMQALQGRSTADITASLIPNGVLPLVGRPEYLQVRQHACKG